MTHPMILRIGTGIPSMITPITRWMSSPVPLLTSGVAKSNTCHHRPKHAPVLPRSNRRRLPPPSNNCPPGGGGMRSVGASAGDRTQPARPLSTLEDPDRPSWRRRGAICRGGWLGGPDPGQHQAPPAGCNARCRPPWSTARAGMVIVTNNKSVPPPIRNQSLQHSCPRPPSLSSSVDMNGEMCAQLLGHHYQPSSLKTSDVTASTWMGMNGVILP